MSLNPFDAGPRANSPFASFAPPPPFHPSSGMKVPSSQSMLTRIGEIVSQETGKTLSESALAEIEALLRAPGGESHGTPFSLRGQVLISESTYERCKEFVETSDVMDIHVKGKPKPVSLREVISIPSLNLKVPRQEIRRSHRVEVRLPFTFQRILNGKIGRAHV